MAEPAQLSAAHLRRAAIVYVRQSSPTQPTQLARNTESTARQYALATRARELGFPPAAVEVIDEDLGVSGSGVAERSGFARLTAQVALGQVGLVLGLEVARLARNNADWYRLLDLCALTDTLIGDDRRRRRSVPPTIVQRSARAGAQGHHERGRAARAPRPPGRRDPQQGRQGRAAPRPARRAGLGPAARRDPVAP
jgi:resolvase-like protein